ncbi:MAG: DMT family transporter [Oscillospiraceae bacterium]|nr:DMT family transporter [Oscillospiraceae bacterium]
MYNRRKGILCILSAAFFFAMMNTFVRLAGDLPSIQKSFFRNVVALIFSTCILLRSEEKFRFDIKNLPYLFGRSFFGTIGILGNFYAIDHLLLSDSSMLNKLSPFFAMIFSYFILKEKISPVQGLSLIAAMTGCALIVKPGTGMFAGHASIIGIIGGAGAGLAYTFVRILSKRGERSAFIVFFFSVFSTLVTIPFILAHHEPMSLYQFIMLICAGFSACGGQFSITAAYSNAPASEISVFDYTQVIFAAVWGFVLFHQLPDVWSVVGYAMIIGTAVLMFLRREKKAG